MENEYKRQPAHQHTLGDSLTNPTVMKMEMGMGMVPEQEDDSKCREYGDDK